MTYLRVNGLYFVDTEMRREPQNYGWTTDPAKATAYDEQTAVGIAQRWRKSDAMLLRPCVYAEVVGEDLTIVDPRDEVAIAGHEAKVAEALKKYQRKDVRPSRAFEEMT